MERHSIPPTTFVKCFVWRSSIRMSQLVEELVANFLGSRLILSLEANAPASLVPSMCRFSSMALKALFISISRVLSTCRVISKFLSWTVTVCTSMHGSTSPRLSKTHQRQKIWPLIGSLAQFVNCNEVSVFGSSGNLAATDASIPIIDIRNIQMVSLLGMTRNMGSQKVEPFGVNWVVDTWQGELATQVDGRKAVLLYSFRNRDVSPWQLV